MAQSGGCCSWFKHYCCCCCCKCSCDNSVETTTVHTPLLAKKEPVKAKEDGFSELEVKEEDAGETQLMEVMVVGDEDESKDSPQLSLRTEKTEPTTEVQTTVHSPPQSEPSTFVRGTGSRSSWRVVPTITSQAKEAAAAAAAKSNVAQVEKSPSESKEKSIQPTASQERDASTDEHERNVVLLPHDLDDDDDDESATLEETNVTITFSFNDTITDQSKTKDIQSVPSTGDNNQADTD